MAFSSGPVFGLVGPAIVHSFTSASICCMMAYAAAKSLLWCNFAAPAMRGRVFGVCLRCLPVTMLGQYCFRFRPLLYRPLLLILCFYNELCSARLAWSHVHGMHACWVFMVFKVDTAPGRCASCIYHEPFYHACIAPCTPCTYRETPYTVGSVGELRHSARALCAVAAGFGCGSRPAPEDTFVVVW